MDFHERCDLSAQLTLGLESLFIVFLHCSVPPVAALLMLSDAAADPLEIGGAVLSAQGLG
jgi:hypothetical protein